MSVTTATGIITSRLRNRRIVPSDNHDGSIIILAPVVAVIAIVLGAFLVDLNFLYLAKAELENRVEAAATAAANTISLQSYYLRSSLAIDSSSAQDIATGQITSSAGSGYVVSQVNVVIQGNSVCIAAHAHVNLPAFGEILGATAASGIQARSIATLASVSASIPRIVLLQC